MRSRTSLIIAGQGARRGFTLLEMLIVLTVVALLMGLGALGVRQLAAALAPRALARQVASTLRLGRAQAVAANRETRVRLLPSGASSGGRPTLLLQRGNLPRDSTQWEDCPRHKVEFPADLAMGVTLNCTPEDGVISFNPDGSSNARYVCILTQDERQGLRRRYAVGVSHAATGRVQVLRWNPSKDCFE